MQRRSLIALAALATTVTVPALAQSGDIKIAHVYSKTGPLEAYGKQTQAGLMMGLQYATGGTMTVNGKKITVIEKDDQGKPDLGKSLLAAAYSDDKVDLAVGPTSSGVALAMLPVAEEYKKILLVEPRWPIRSPATSGTSTSSAPAATPAKTPSATLWRWTRKVSRSPRWRRTTPSGATA